MSDPFEEELKRAFARQPAPPAEDAAFVARMAQALQRSRRRQRALVAAALLLSAVALAWLAPWVSQWFDLWVAAAPVRLPALLHWVVTPLGAVLALATLGLAAVVAYGLRRSA